MSTNPINLKKFFLSNNDQDNSSGCSLEGDEATIDTKSSHHSRLWKRLNLLTRKDSDDNDSNSNFNYENDVSRRHRKLGVSFTTTVKIREIPSVFDYTTEEKDEIWYTTQEYDRIFENVDKTVEKMEQKVKLSKKYCSRGLEYMTEERYIQRVGRRMLAIQTVLDQQSSKRDLGESCPSPYITAKLYAKFSNESRIAARLAAQQDEWDAKGYLSPSRDMAVAQACHHMSFQKRIRDRMEEEPLVKDVLDVVPEEASSQHDDESVSQHTSSDRDVRSRTYQPFFRPRLLRADGSFRRIMQFDESLRKVDQSLRKVDESIRNLVKGDILRQDYLRGVFRRENPFGRERFAEGFRRAGNVVVSTTA